MYSFFVTPTLKKEKMHNEKDEGYVCACCDGIYLFVKIIAAIKNGIKTAICIPIYILSCAIVVFIITYLMKASVLANRNNVSYGSVWRTLDFWSPVDEDFIQCFIITIGIIFALIVVCIILRLTSLYFKRYFRVREEKQRRDYVSNTKLLDDDSSSDGGIRKSIQIDMY